MSWEAFRLTSKSPSELYDVLGPEGVDHLVRQFMTACWNALPAGTRTFTAWRKLADEVFARNMRIWKSIKKPNPVAFFQNLGSTDADGHLRQAMVMSWMMLPRTGGRDFKETQKIIARIYERNLASWEEDNRTFTGKGTGKKKTTKTTKKKSVVKKKKIRK